MKENKFETDAIRNQLDRTQFQEHSTPMYLTSSFVFDDAEDMRASFAEEKGKHAAVKFFNVDRKRVCLPGQLLLISDA